MLDWSVTTPAPFLKLKVLMMCVKVMFLKLISSLSFMGKASVTKKLSEQCVVWMLSYFWFLHIWLHSKKKKHRLWFWYVYRMKDKRGIWIARTVTRFYQIIACTNCWQVIKCSCWLEAQHSKGNKYEKFYISYLFDAQIFKLFAQFLSKTILLNM